MPSLKNSTKIWVISDQKDLTGYEKDIIRYIRKKCKCMKDRKPNKQQTAPLQSIIRHELFELVTIDYLHLDQSKRGMNNFLLW